jgi:hypothetical protein
MDHSTLSSLASVLMPLAAGLVTVLSGRRAGRTTDPGGPSANRIKEPVTRGDRSSDAIDENVETSVALLEELDRIEQRLREGFEDHVAANPRWDRIPPIITPVYEELCEQERVAKLGSPIADLVGEAYEEIAKLNAALEVVKRKAEADPGRAITQPEQYLGDAWSPIPAAKARFLGMLPTVERGLREVGIPSEGP